jgi:hypothetical protein
MRYRKVSTRIWADDRFLQLSKSQPSAQTLFLYLITGPHSTSLPGLFVAGEAMLAEALGWDLKGFREAFAELSRVGSGDGHEYPLAVADWTARLVFLPRAIRHNPPENPNIVKGWKATWTELPECDLKGFAHAVFEAEISVIGDGHAKAFASSIERPKGSGKGFGKGFDNGSVKPLPNRMPNQEQEQEQEQEKNLALFAVAPSEATEEKAPRGRPPKDTPEIVTDREQWLAKARALIGLTPEQTPPGKALFVRFAQQRKRRGMEQLLRALEGLEKDPWARQQGLQPLLSDAVIEKGLATAARRANVVGIGFDETWDRYAKEAGLVGQ